MRASHFFNARISDSLRQKRAAEAAPVNDQVLENLAAICPARVFLLERLLFRRQIFPAGVSFEFIISRAL
jgi:hypothetical protein